MIVGIYRNEAACRSSCPSNNTSYQVMCQRILDRTTQVADLSSRSYRGAGARRAHLEDALDLALHRLADGDALAGAQQQREADVVAPPPQQDPASSTVGTSSRCADTRVQNFKALQASANRYSQLMLNDADGSPSLLATAFVSYRQHQLQERRSAACTLSSIQTASKRS